MPNKTSFHAHEVSSRNLKLRAVAFNGEVVQSLPAFLTSKLATSHYCQVNQVVIAPVVSHSDLFQTPSADEEGRALLEEYGLFIGDLRSIHSFIFGHANLY